MSVNDGSYMYKIVEWKLYTTNWDGKTAYDIATISAQNIVDLQAGKTITVNTYGKAWGFPLTIKPYKA